MNTSNYAHCDRLKITKQKLKFTSNFLEVNMFEKKCKLKGIIKGKDDKPHLVAILHRVVNSGETASFISSASNVTCPNS